MAKTAPSRVFAIGKKMQIAWQEIQKALHSLFRKVSFATIQWYYGVKNAQHIAVILRVRTSYCYEVRCAFLDYSHSHVTNSEMPNKCTGRPTDSFYTELKPLKPIEAAKWHVFKPFRIHNLWYDLQSLERPRSRALYNDD